MHFCVLTDPVVHDVSHLISLLCLPFRSRQLNLFSLLTEQLVSIPYAEALLHVDCSGEEVSCELSPYSFQQEGNGLCSASWFLATIRLSSGISIVLLLRGPSCSSQKEGHDVTLHPKLRIPMSKEGTLLTTGDQVAWDPSPAQAGTPTAGCPGPYSSSF